jgi:LydA holin phage, holin superfamily III
MLDHPWFLKLSYIALAWFGGAMGYVMGQLEKEKKVSFWRMLTEGTASAFVGIIVMLLCQAMKLSPEWTGVVVGVCGWLGANVSIRLLEKAVKKRIGVNDDDQ